MLQPLLADLPAGDRNVWALVAVAAGGLLYFLIRPGKPKKDPLDRPQRTTSLAQQRNVERQMESLLVELSEMARQMNAQLDTRSAKLEALIDDADRRIAALQRGLSEPVSIAPPIAAATPPAEPAIAQSAAASQGANHAPMAVEPMPLNPQHAEVYALADVGTAAIDIARQLNRPRGEVELILALRSRSG